MHEWFETQLETFNSDNVMKILAVGWSKLEMGEDFVGNQV